MPREVVWAWDGPVRLAVWREPVTHGARQWLQHGITVQDGRPGVVVVLEDSSLEEPRVLLVRQPRPAVGDVLWELPRGLGESPGTTDEEVVGDGERELVEETGLVAGGWEVLGRFWPDSGLLSGAVHVVRAQLHGAALEGRPAAGTDGEVDALRWARPADLTRMVATGELRDGISLAALALHAARPPSGPGSPLRAPR